MWEFFCRHIWSEQATWSIATYLVLFLGIEGIRRKWPQGKKAQLSDKQKEKLRIELAADIIRVGNKWENKHKQMDSGEVLFVITALAVGFQKRIKTREDFEAMVKLLWEAIKIERVE